MPANTPFAVAIDTDLDGDQYKAADAILNKFPGADTIKNLLKAQLEMGQEGVKFDDDIKPLLGNPAVISATDVSSFLSDSEEAGFVAALQVKDTDALDSLIDKTKPKKLGEVAGGTVYQDGDTYFAVDDDVVVLGGSRELVNAALERADGGDSLSEDDFEASLDGLPDESLARVYVDVQGLLGNGERRRGGAQDPVGRRAAHARPHPLGARQGGRHRLQPAHRGRPQRGRAAARGRATRRPRWCSSRARSGSACAIPAS